MGIRLPDQSKKDREGFWHYQPSHWLAQAAYGKEVVDSPEEFYRQGEQTSLAARDTALYVKVMSEWRWVRHRRPFYRVWPKLTPYLLRLNDSRVTGDLVQLPYPVFGIFFHASERSIPSVPGYPVRSILFGWPELNLAGAPPGERPLLMVMDLGERLEGLPVVSWFRMAVKPDQSVFDAVEELADVVLPSAKEGIVVPHETIRGLIRIGLALCFMSSGGEEDVITPYVERPAEWSKGRGKPKLLKPEKLREDAFDVGKSFTVQPHWRSPSPLALYWTGKGRKIPRLRYRRGCVVRRKKVQVEYDGSE